MKQLFYLKQTAIIIFLFSVTSLIPHDNPHFYRASYLFNEPRFEREWLSSFDVTFGGGSTSKGRNGCGDIVPVLDMFGTHNMQKLALGVPNLDPNNELDSILINLSQTPIRNNFASFSIKGKFKIIESQLSFMQNLKKGFFIHCHLPIRNLKFKFIQFNDLSPVNESEPNKSTPEWQQFLQSFDAILMRYNLSSHPFNKTGAGDFTTYIGWTRNYEGTKKLDYIDYTFKAGILAPTGATRNQNNIFALPLGYDGHWGFPFSATVSFGALEWLTWGAYLKTMFFAPKTKKIRLQTDLHQQGLIKLAKGCVTIDKGTLWHAGLYLKADHFMRGLSFSLGYSFAGKTDDKLTPKDSTLFDPTIINSDEQYKGWKNHTFHLFFEYDFTQENMKYGPRLGFFYNAQIGGQRVFKTGIFGGSLGLEIAWDV
jgi:hypothetical protein